MDSKGRQPPVLLMAKDSRMGKLPQIKPLVGNRMDKNKIVVRARQTQKKIMTPIIIKTLEKIQILKKVKQRTLRMIHRIPKIKMPNPKMDKKLPIKTRINNKIMKIPKMINRIPKKPKPIMVPTPKKLKTKQMNSKMVERPPKILPLTNKIMGNKKRRCHPRMRMGNKILREKGLLRTTPNSRIKTKSLKKRKKAPLKTRTLKKVNMFQEVTPKVERHKLIGGGETRKKSHGGGISGRSGMRLSLLSQS